MPDKDKILKVIETERECVARQQCNRDCLNCDLVLDSKDILEVYDEIIKIYRD